MYPRREINLIVGPDGDQYNWCGQCSLDFSKDWLHEAMGVAKLKEWVSPVHYPLSHANPTTCKPDHGKIQITYAFLLCLSKIVICFPSWTQKELYQHNQRDSKKGAGVRGADVKGEGTYEWLGMFLLLNASPPSKHSLKLWCHRRSKIKHLGEELL